MGSSAAMARRPNGGALLGCIRPSRSTCTSTTFVLVNHRVMLRLGTRFAASTEGTNLLAGVAETSRSILGKVSRLRSSLIVSAGQHDDRSQHVQQHGAVDTSAARREVVDAEHTVGAPGQTALDRRLRDPVVIAGDRPLGQPG